MIEASARSSTTGTTHATGIAVVGAGILGLAHAWAAHRHGLRVTVFERSAAPVGASIRNFGQVLVTGQAPGAMHRLALRTRQLWVELSRAAGFAAEPLGSLLFSRTEAEHAVLEEFIETRARDQGYEVELLTGHRLNALYGGRFSHHRGALAGTQDLQLYSREALPALVAYLESQGVEFRFGTLVKEVGAGRLSTTQGQWHADHIVVCSGHDYQTLCADALAGIEQARSVCRLQMLRVAPEQPFELAQAVLTGLSLVHYGAFSDLPCARALREQLEASHPELIDNGIHLLVSPTPYGEFIVGDSHHYGQDALPFSAERVDELMLGLASDTLACPLRIVERWQGVYGGPGPGPYSVTPVDPTVTAVLMHSGVGMTVGLALGEQTLDCLLS